ncbi:MAG TPA: ferritin-like domain-containing protein [Blastocatellia bacterium]|nr:ferritin-like domain-containing protein [Blastocatellia bacterium]
MAASPKEVVEAFVEELEEFKKNVEAKLTLVPKELLEDLQSLKDATARDIRSGKYGSFSFGDVSVPPEMRQQVVSMLKVLVFPELSVADQVAQRIPQLTDLDFKARASQQIIDELSHARVLRELLQSWNEDPDEMYQNPLPEIEAVFKYVGSLETPVEYFTANFMCEGLFLPSHLNVMAELDPDAFAPYIQATLADEARHIALARDVITRYATTFEVQQRCRKVAEEVTALFVEGFQAKVEKLLHKQQ